MGAHIELPLERPLFTPSMKPRLADLVLEAGEDDIDTARLFDQIVVDKARLRAAVRRALRRQPQITLRELLDAEPLQQGLAELVAYLELAHAGAAAVPGRPARHRRRSGGGIDPLAGPALRAMR